jgi:hypothetical protein
MRYEGKRKSYKRARLVCETFHGAPPEGAETDHKDGDKTNDHADNLEWVTRQENIRRWWAAQPRVPEAAGPPPRQSSVRVTVEDRRLKFRGKVYPTALVSFACPVEHLQALRDMPYPSVSEAIRAAVRALILLS